MLARLLVRLALAAGMALAATGAALAQSPGTLALRSPINGGSVLSQESLSAAVNAQFTAKQDYLGFAPYSAANPAGYQTLSQMTAAIAVETTRATGAETLLAPKANPVFTGTVTIPSGASIAGYAPTASPTFTGTVTLTTLASATSFLQITSPNGPMAAWFAPSSAVNYVSFNGGAAGTPGSIASGGFDANQDLPLIPAGTGSVTVPKLKINGSQITLSGAFTTSGAFTVTLTATAATSLTLPTSGTLATTANISTAIPSAATTAPECGSGAAGAVAACGATMVLPNGTTATTQTAGDNSTKAATTAYANGAVSTETTRATTAEALLAPKASPTITGVLTTADLNVTGTSSTNMAGAWSTTTSTLTCTSGSLTTSSSAVRYAKLGRVVTFSMQLTITTLGTCATSFQATLPFATATSAPAVFAGREISATGKALTGSVGGASNVMNVQYYDNSFAPASGNVFIISGSYEAAS